MNRSLLFAALAASLFAAVPAGAAPADRYGLSADAPSEPARPLWKRILALEWIERAPRLAAATPGAYAAPAQAAQAAGPLLTWPDKSQAAASPARLAAATVPERLPGGLYARAISHIQPPPGSAAASGQTTMTAPAVDPRPRQFPTVP